jgi:hypothetical protein
MASCGYCGSTILFGGVRDGDLRFCNENCRQQGFLLAVADQVPEDVISQHVSQVHEGNCPKCGGPGPIDVHTSYSVWSALVLTSWRSRPEVCCRACGIKAKLGRTLSSVALGWWGVPWGIIITPIQVLRNMMGLFSSPDPIRLSAQLENIVKVHLAAHLVKSSCDENCAAEPGAAADGGGR